MANEALTLSEEIIRNRVNLQHDNLEDVKALSLPGTYHEKVVSLGGSLRKFSRLKSLDLSRNALICLQGMEHLKLLEKLNLYYNGIETMDELKRLRFNTSLKELDLRLNPVTRTEPDYRLYLIHMLPNLQKLDDRGVRDRERNAALVHFSSSQAVEISAQPSNEEPPPKQPHPRAEMVRGMGKGMTALDDDDVAVLDLIARTGGDLSRPRNITGSAAREPTAEDYSLEVLKSLDGGPAPDNREEVPAPKPHPGSREEAYRMRYPNIPSLTVTGTEERQQRKDENLQYQDEVDAYSKFKSHGYFTANPNQEQTNAGNGNTSQSQILTERDPYPGPPRVPTERRRSFGEEESVQGHQRSNSQPPARKEFHDSMEDLGMRRADRSADDLRSQRSNEPHVSNGIMKGENSRSKELLSRLLDIVDRYWNGSKSLHKNIKFRGLAYELIDNFARNYGEDLSKVEGDLAHLREENFKLRKREEITRNTLADSTVNESQLKTSLHQAYKDNEALKDELQNTVRENRKLQMKVQEQQNGHLSAAATSLSSVNQSHLEEIKRQNDILRNEVEMLQIRLKQYSQMQELASMLQESHKSLVQTNDHLLKDLGETKRRHQGEVEQLNWTYNQLKKNSTSGYAPSNKARDHGTASATMYDS
ncbi:centrosomal protein of 72 kDa-like isoform X2 [Mizuhopecten yessoensis]|uniref:Centrosomal protein of 72 kDa n=1 Tax=Mizuhopecten yessoensis TaxID=6573 RepID=A0A210PRT0_MIZYE|nr:centrosomal protein of 72 kDa-like isoform X2 [Mizuhopecten yessoensis]OWF39191.1 Centrosomal protein of 72 kDa [Mizuhopecten yessoensis]